VSAPLVSVVTPFYNTAPYLDECIRSVLRQTWTNVEYILLDNCSTDGSAEIARRHAAEHEHIRLARNDSLLGQVDNYNRALSLISPESKYCLLVQADDWIMPECVQRMVELAETDPRIGVVTSYHLEGKRPCGGPIDPSISVLDGLDVCRQSLLGKLAVFGSPTTVMYRSEIIRARQPFFDRSRHHEDTDALFRTLRDWKLGFVHQLLSFVRVDNASITSAVRNFDPFALDAFLRSRMYLDQFFAPAEAQSLRRQAETSYLKFVAERCLARNRREFLAYQRRGLTTVGYSLPRGRLMAYVLWELLDRIGNPKRTLSGLFRKAT
jgi:glycosyltransferase involved in cell wall biosynthesis